MGSDIAVRAVCSMLNYHSRLLGSSLAPRWRPGVRKRAEGGAAAQASAVASPWTAAAPAGL